MIKKRKFKLLFFLLTLLNGCSYKNPAVINNIDIVDNGICTSIKDQETALWNNNFNINNDYIGTIIFDSGLLNVDIVQGKTNEDYLRVNWKDNSYNKYGSVCLNADNTIDDQNLLVFGHTAYKSIDPSGLAMLTPLHKLKENIKDNSTFKLILSNETRVYQIAYVYDCVLTNENGMYFAPAGLDYNNKYYSADEIASYQENIKKTNHFDIGITLTEDDKLLTFQTCEETDKSLRLIVVSKLLKTYAR